MVATLGLTDANSVLMIVMPADHVIREAAADGCLGEDDMVRFDDIYSRHR